MKSTAWKEVVWGDYQKEVILPNLLRLLTIKKSETILDLGCGAGLFAEEFKKAGAKIIGVDPAKNLIAEAKERVPDGEFFVGSADNLKFIKDRSVDKIAIVLAIQNMENVHKVFAECRRVLKVEGKMFFVLNHPAFRIPKTSDWGWDPSASSGQVKGIMYRRIDAYLSESKEKIQTHPGDRPQDYTISFHRPLQFYFKLLGNNGFAVSRLEEWTSHKKSEAGPRAKAEDKARKEIPLFLALETVLK